MLNYLSVISIIRFANKKYVFEKTFYFYQSELEFKTSFVQSNKEQREHGLE